MRENFIINRAVKEAQEQSATSLCRWNAYASSSHDGAIREEV